jgi:hypothetical protein
MTEMATNGTGIDTHAAHCDIDLTDYNYSLLRAVLASCNELHGPHDALVLIVGFAGASFWICGDLIAQVCLRFSSWQILYPWSVASALDKL